MRVDYFLFLYLALLAICLEARSIPFLDTAEVLDEKNFKPIRRIITPLLTEEEIRATEHRPSTQVRSPEMEDTQHPDVQIDENSDDPFEIKED